MCIRITQGVTIAKCKVMCYLKNRIRYVMSMYFVIKLLHNVFKYVWVNK